MDVLTLSTACILCAAQPSVPATVARWDPIIADASARFAIPKTWIARVMQVESGGRTHLNGRPIMSPAGAMGLMQLMPHTYDAMRRRYHLGSDPFDPRDNILAGTAYLRAMYDRFGAHGFLAAYNAGPARARAYLDRGEPPPQETQSYLAKLNRPLPDPHSPAKSATADMLFVPLAVPGIGLSKLKPEANPASQTRRIPTPNRVVRRADSNAQPSTLFFSLSHSTP